MPFVLFFPLKVFSHGRRFSTPLFVEDLPSQKQLTNQLHLSKEKQMIIYITDPLHVLGSLRVPYNHLLTHILLWIPLKRYDNWKQLDQHIYFLFHKSSNTAWSFGILTSFHLVLGDINFLSTPHQQVRQCCICCKTL